MKYLRVLSAIIFASALLFAGCSFLKHTGTVKTTNKLNIDEVLASDSDNYNSIPPLIPLSMQATNALLNDADMASVLSSEEDDSYNRIYNGFGDKNHYRIEFYFGKITKDKSTPKILTVEGKTRFKKKIQAFTGTIVIDSAYRIGDDSTSEAYHLKGTFHLAENKGLKGNGEYTGTIYLDMAKITNDDKVTYYADYANETATKHGAVLLDGTWKEYNSHATRPLLAAKEFFYVAENILSDFTYGERDRSISEKYRPFGWDNYWSNEEWWADDKPSTTSL